MTRIYTDFYIVVFQFINANYKLSFSHGFSRINTDESLGFSQKKQHPCKSV